LRIIVRLFGMSVLLALCGLAHATTEWSAQDYNLYSGDFNGDGKTDILYIAKKPNMPSGIALSDGNGPNIAWQSWPSDFLGINWSGNAYNVIVADFNGDGKADIFLQSVTPGNSYLLLTSAAGYVVSVSQTIPETTMGLMWSADQHRIIAGAFAGRVNGHPKADLFLQATSSSGTDAIVLSDANGMFTAASPAQTWTDGYLGFNWSTPKANVFAGDFNGDGYGDLLIQAIPNFVTINYDVPFPVPTYPPNLNGVVLAQTTSPIFTAAGVQAWSRMSNGVDWSPLTNNIVIGTNGSNQATVILQAKYTGQTSYELVGNATGAIFPSSATAISSNVNLSADTSHLIAANFAGGSGIGLYVQALTPSGTDYVSDAVGATTTASAQNPAAVTGTVEAASVGRTKGHFQVSSAGSAQYRIPIWAPPGPKGMQPQISLFYDSQSSIGPLGIGWSLAGLGSITRCNKTVAQDTTPAPVALAATDGYCINGNRLRVTSGPATYGQPGSTYQTEIADFSQITAVGTAGNNGPASFTVQARNGLTYYYGFTDSNGNGANSQVLANGTSTAVTWLLSKVFDRAGNNYVINYTALTGTAVPSKILWTPTSAGASTYAYTMQFNYTANVPQSSINQYVAGTLVSNAQLLSSIEILSAGTVVKEYFLGYKASALTWRKELISVQECADSAQSNCLSPTSVGYQTGIPGLSTASVSALSSTGSQLTARYDLNGDGIPDLVYNNGTDWYVSFGSSSGYQAPINTNIPSSAVVLPGNLNAGSEDGLLATNGSTWYYYTWNGSAFTGTSTGLAFDSTALQYQLADVNGDGRPDLVSLYLNTSTYVVSVDTRLNSTSGTTVSFSSTLTTAYSATLVAFSDAWLQTPDSQFGKLRHFDFNGDRRDDIVLVTQSQNSKTGNLPTNTYELISNGSTFTATDVAAYNAANSSKAPAFFVDWNDDACTDYVFNNTLYVSGCNGTVPESYALSGTILAALDWNGDKRTDILVANGSTIGVYLSTATGAPSLTATSTPYASTCQYVTMDTTGDGLDDLGCWGQSGSHPVTYYPHNGVSDSAAFFADGYGNSVSPTYASILQSSNYSPYPYASPAYPLVNYLVPLSVVTNATFSDPSALNGNTYYQTFLYTGAWADVTGRGFSNFLTWQQFDSRNGLWRKLCLSNKFPWTGMHECDELSQDQLQNQMLVLTGTSNETSTTLDSTANNQRYFPYIGTTTTLKYELNGNTLTSTTVTNYSYDNYGNATNVATTVTDNDPNSPYTGDTWTTSVTNTTDISVNQSTDLAQWCLPLLAKTQVMYSSQINGSNTITRTQGYTLDTPTNCRVMGVTTEPNSSLYKVTESLGFDGFGNINSDTVTGINMPSPSASRVTTSNWGTTGQFLATQTDPSGATTTWTYGSAQSLAFGVPDSVKDANNLTTSWGYDAFGRKSTENRPDGTSTSWIWSPCTSQCGWSNSVYQIAQTAYQSNGTAIRTDTNLYDSINRVTQSSGPTVTGAPRIVQKLYNSSGLLVQQSIPFLSGAPAYQQTYTYDALKRPLTITRPISSTNTNLQSTTFAYSGRTRTVTDPYSHVTTTITDVNGKLRQTKDPIGYSVTRSYDAAGSLIGVTDSVGNTLLKNVTYQYGIKPFLVASTDADRGAWTYTVDSLGERTGWTDAKGQSFSETYDALSRPMTRTEPDLFTQWTWGSTPALDNVGQLIAECTSTTGTPTTGCGNSPLYSETRKFDAAGRLSTRAITQSGNPGNDLGGVFQFTLGYSPTTGQLSTLTYPTSTSGVALNLQYGYQYGILQSVTDTTDTASTCGSTCVLWTANAMNGFGQITQETLGNGVVTNRSYDGVTSWLTSATGGVGGGAALLNQSYLQDEDGNVIQRQNNNLGLTENFAYDADNRLTCSTLTGSSCSTPTLVYDGGSAGPGNITSQAGVGTYTYPAAGQSRPHAVTSITGTFNGIANPAFSYDANGNMTARASSAQNITWSSYNYPTAIAASDATGNEQVQLFYGPDRQRWEQIYTNSTTTEQTYYIGGLVDLVFSGGTTNYRHYIYAGNEPVAVYSRTAAGVNTMSYMLEDHQGGASAIASSAGTADVNESFSAFGTRRNPTTWTGPPTTSDLNTIASLSRQGYTFQTALGQSMGLNHMNGRVEDAILGRFLSPDPHIPDPTNAQSYNRYSYVRNNPLTRVDPTGFKDCVPASTCPGELSYGGGRRRVGVGRWVR